jgi:pimeloyl-ACP methyl ester carboxylesterase
MPDAVLLVHGAWHGAWCWDKVAPELRRRGFRVAAIDLPGHGSDPEPLTDLHGDATKVREALSQLGEPALLVGHSYGGAVISEACDHPLAESLVFLAAFPLDVGETCLSAAVEESEANGISWEGRPNLGEGLATSPDGATSTLDPDAAAACLYNDCDPAAVEWALDRLGPHPLANLGQSPHSAAWKAKPSTYVVCSGDLVVHPELQRLMARRCSSSVEWSTGHSPFLSRPELVVELLTNVGRSGSGRGET